MDEYQNHIKFRGGRLSMAVIAVAFSAVLLTRFVPAFLPDYTGLGGLSREATEALGCIDFEGAAILEALRRETGADPSGGEAAAREFARARDRGERAAGSAERLRTCAKELARASPRLAAEGEAVHRAEEVAEALVAVYSARAAVLSLEYAALEGPDGTLSFPDPGSAAGHADAGRRMDEAWKAAEARVTGMSEWIGRKLSGQRQ